MPSARELLEQADALMRRNRGEGGDRAARPASVAETGRGSDDPLRGYLPDGPAADDVGSRGDDAPLVPTVILSDYGDVPTPTTARIVRDALALPSQTGFAGPAAAGEVRSATWLETLADLPVLTDVVDVGALPAEPPAPEAESQPAADWSVLAEEIRAQVLQRLDLFTDTGLREQLGTRLQPIVDHASAELVDTINRQVGELVRSYVAEAIEREIEAWRNRSA